MENQSADLILQKTVFQTLFYSLNLGKLLGITRYWFWPTILPGLLC